MNNNTCCFSGHRKLPASKLESIISRLDVETENLIHQGVTEFIIGGALGFDQLAAAMIVVKKEMGYKIRLIFAFPCRNHEMHWPEKQKRLQQALLMEADEVRYVSEEYSNDCMQARNRYMVERSGYCICAMLYEKSGTAQTVRYAKSKGLQVINIAD